MARRAAPLLAALLLARGMCLRMGRAEEELMGTEGPAGTNASEIIFSVNGTAINTSELTTHCYVMANEVLFLAPWFEPNTADYLLNGLQTGSQVFGQEDAAEPHAAAAKHHTAAKAAAKPHASAGKNAAKPHAAATPHAAAKPHAVAKPHAAAGKAAVPKSAGKKQELVHPLVDKKTLGGGPDVGDAEVNVGFKPNQDLSWLTPLKERGVKINAIPLDDGFDPTIAYVKLLIASYDSNASMQVFLHGDAPIAHYSPEGLVDYIAQIDPTKVNAKYGGYASLNHPYHGATKDREHRLLEYRMDCRWRDDPWVAMLKNKWNLWDAGAFFGNVGRYCCTQFVVTKEAIRKFPKEFYYHLLKRVMAPQPWAPDSWKTIGKSMSMLWHTIFTGKINEPMYSYQAIATCPDGLCHAQKRKSNKTNA